MKIFRATAAVAFFAAICIGSGSAQTRNGSTTPATSPAASSSTTVNVPDSKIALINSEDFADEKTGIVRLVNAARKLQKELEPEGAKLQQLDQQIQKATADLAKVAAMQTQVVNQQQQDKIDQMKRDLQRKNEDLQAVSNKRQQEVFGPILDDIGKALDAYAKAHGITLVLDVSKVQGIVYAPDSLDITKAFIADFNSKNPATASLAPLPK